MLLQKDIVHFAELGNDSWHWLPTQLLIFLDFFFSINTTQFALGDNQIYYTVFIANLSLYNWLNSTSSE